MRKTRFLLLLCLFCLLSAAHAWSESAVLIHEVMASNATWKGGHAWDWVEIHNVSGKTVDLSGWHLSDSKKKPDKWTFPDGAKIRPGEYLLIYCTGQEMTNKASSPWYAPFKLSASGDQVLLTDASGQLADRLDFPLQYGNIPWGRTDDLSDVGYLEEGTPGSANGKKVFECRAPAPVLKTPGGFFRDEAAVTAATPGGTLRYTTDGSTPTVSSPVFPQDGLVFRSTTVLRLRTFQEDCVPSAAISATYFINESLPVSVVSLITDPDLMFGKKYGALARGTGSVPNYDKDYEYPVNIEYFSADGTCEINQMGSFTASGHSARQNAQKSIALYARKALGDEYFRFSPFPHRDYALYKSLLLRSTNSDAYSERLRDVVFSSLAEPLDLCYQDAVPIVVFINGEYWGHYNLREKINKYMVAQWEGIDLENEDVVDAIDILARTGSDDYVQNGSNADWLELCRFCKTMDLNDAENLKFVTDRMDVDSLFTHASFEIILGNTDITNVRMYRVPGGKWKYLLFDVEAGFGSGSDTSTVPLENYIKKVSAKVQAFRHEPLNALLNVPAMKDQFLRTFAHVLETCFTWPYVEEHFTPWQEILEELLPRHNKRWPFLTMSRWRTNVSATMYYARVRPKKIIGMLSRRMKLTSEETEIYFGDLQRKLEITNARP